MALIKQEALTLLKECIEQEVASLKGKICDGPAAANHRKQFPSLSINPIRFNFFPDQPECHEDISPSECILNVGRWEAIVQLTLSANSHRQRAELEQCITDIFLAGECGPGTLVFEAANCYDGTVVYTMDETDWDNEKAWDKKWNSQMTVTLELPALVLRRECYTINEINVQFSEDLSQEAETTSITCALTDGGAVRAFQFTVPSDGDSWSVSIPAAVGDMPDSSYAAAPFVTSIPSGGSNALLYVPNSSKTPSGFTLEASGTLKAGTIVDVILRDS